MTSACSLLGLIGVCIALGYWGYSQHDMAAWDAALRETLAHVEKVEDCTIPRPDLDGKPVFLTGPVQTETALGDPEFNIPAEPRLALVRRVEYRRWVCYTEDEKYWDDKEQEWKTKTRLCHRAEWVSEEKCNEFLSDVEGTDEPMAATIPELDVTASCATLGAYTLGVNLVAKVARGKLVTITPAESYTVPEPWQGRAVLHRRDLYITAPGHTPDPDKPCIGDVRVSWYDVAAPQECGILCGVKGGELVPYMAGDRAVEIVCGSEPQGMEKKLAERKEKEAEDSAIAFLAVSGALVLSFRLLLFWGEARDTAFWANARLANMWIFSCYLALVSVTLLLALVWIDTRVLVASCALGGSIALHIGYTIWRRYCLRAAGSMVQP